MSNETSSSECPVCWKNVHINLIQHVNDCLNKAEMDSDETQNKLNIKKRKNTETSELIQVESDFETSPKRVKSDNTIDVSSNSNAKMSFFKCFQMKKELKEAQSKDSSNFNSSVSSGSFKINNMPDVSKSEDKNNSKADSKPIDTKLKSESVFINRNDASSSKQEIGNTNSVKAKHSDFFSVSSKYKNANKSKSVPLAEQMRPSSLNDYVGQENAVGLNSLLTSLLNNDQIPSMILWGPPGCGKTTLARIVASKCKDTGNAKFVQLSATNSGVNDVKDLVKIAKNDLKMFKRKTVLFLDEIHRFSKLQQDSLLPHIEDGTIILIGATTENPSFQVNNALLSRCPVIVLQKLSPESLKIILERAVREMNINIFKSSKDIIKTDLNKKEVDIWIEDEGLDMLSHLCDGDARSALNSLEMIIQANNKIDNKKQDDSSSNSSNNSNNIINGNNSLITITKEHIKNGLQRSHIAYDKTGEEHYNMASALQKSIRGSDDSAAIYWVARMLEGGEDPLFIARRLVRTASEDIGLADPLALNQAVATFQACHMIGMPECEVILAQCAVYLARAHKSQEVYQAYTNAKKSVQDNRGSLPQVPLHLRNASSKLMKDLGYGKGYKASANINYLPDTLVGTNFFK